MRTITLKRLGLLAAWLLAVASPLVLRATPAAASEQVNGGGSTWSAIAVQAWQVDVQRQGFTVNYQATGSTNGRNQYINQQYDFAVSEIPFQAKYCPDPTQPTVCNNEIASVTRPYTYMPIVAGGTSLLYNLDINGQPFKNLRLSPHTLTEIFTNVITNWNAADIAADNPGVTFPNQSITPVVRSDGSGTSYQFTAFMNAEDPTLWNNFCKSQQIPTPCPPTSQFPAPGTFAGQSGSDGVANFVHANTGAIGYAEAAYGISVGVPLASLKNVSGNYVQPTAVNVAVALTKAFINTDHTQNLSSVYVNPDPRTYPMSSYSYMIVPTAPVTPPMDLSKGNTLGRFILYFLCQGQQEAAPLGYSPLPPNLVQVGFDVVTHIPGAPAPPPIQQCNNPTITGNFLGQNGIPTGGGSAGPATSHGGTSATTGVTHKGTTNATVAGAAATTTTTITGTQGGPASQTGGNSAAESVALQATSQEFGKPWRPISVFGALVVVILLGGAILGPPAIALWRRRRSA